MGWATGRNNNGRLIGYGIEAICDLPGCREEIDRGLSFCCGALDGTQNGGMDDEPYCGGYFCSGHLFFVPSVGEFGSGITVCPSCYVRAVCPDCEGACVSDGEPCETCDTYGVVTHRFGEAV